MKHENVCVTFERITAVIRHVVSGTGLSKMGVQEGTFTWQHGRWSLKISGYHISYYVYVIE